MTSVLLEEIRLSKLLSAKYYFKDITRICVILYELSMSNSVFVLRYVAFANDLVFEGITG